MTSTREEQEAPVVPEGRSTGSWVVRGSVAGLLAVLCFMTGFSIYTQQRVAALSQRADRANRASQLLQDARFWVGQEESLERAYRLAPNPTVRGLHVQAERRLAADLRRLTAVEHSAVMQSAVSEVQQIQANYESKSAQMFAAVDARNAPLVAYIENVIVEPVSSAMEDIVYQQARQASASALSMSSRMRETDRQATRTLALTFGLGLLLLAAFAFVIASFRRRLDADRVAEVKRLGEMAISDPLTGLRNHRAFQEDLALSLHRVGRTGVPTALVILDLDGLGDINDRLGHQAGDERLQALAEAIRSTGRGSDRAYRIGGDEFAVILDDARAWSALEFVQRLHHTFEASREEGEEPLRATAGITEAQAFRAKDDVIREADLALRASRRSGQHASIYTAEMDPVRSTYDPDADQHSRTLASALARAVDAKDSYTRSHCQTVSQLAGVIASELGFDHPHVARMRLAGLLHDVGKIGIPDAILNKPAKLTEDEYAQMQTHSLLGFDIVAAADLHEEAIWVRHHHERFDGRGYPDRLSAGDIPIESRIILVADAFEAMTSDRPYRKAPGQEFAVAELRRHAGSQFDPQVVEALCRVLGALASTGPLSPAGTTGPAEAQPAAATAAPPSVS